MVDKGWVPPEKLPQPVGWKRWPRAVVAGSVASAIPFYVAPYFLDYDQGVSLYGLFALVAWILGSMVTALVARAETLVEWFVAYALMAGVFSAVAVVLTGAAIAIFSP
jgi:hypothetical protein